MRIRIGSSYNCNWIFIRTGETKDLPESVGKRAGLRKVKVTQIAIGETKQIEEPDNFTEDIIDDTNFKKELISIKGIGQRTAIDIIKIFGDRNELIRVIKTGDILPVRDDVENKLRRYYG